MTIYNWVELIILILFIVELIARKPMKYRRIIFYIGTFLLLFVLGFRNYNVGGDTPGYCDFFTGKSAGFYGSLFDKKSSIEPGFIYISKFLHLICSDWRWFIFSSSLISLLPFLCYVRNKAIFPSFAFLSFLLPFNLLFLIQTPIRQCFAISVFILGGYIWEKAKQNTDKKSQRKQQIFSLILMFFGIMTHTSMYIIAPLAICCYFVKFNKKTALFWIILTFFLSLFVSSLFTYFYDYLFQLTSSLNAFQNINQYHDSINYEIADDISIGAIAPRSLFTILVILLSGEKQNITYNYKCLMFACCLMNISVSFPLASRIVLFFSLLGSSYVPSKLDKKNRLKDKVYCKFYISLLFLLFMLIFYKHYELCYNFKKTISTDILPYSFWF